MCKKYIQSFTTRVIFLVASLPVNCQNVFHKIDRIVIEQNLVQNINNKYYKLDQLGDSLIISDGHDLEKSGFIKFKILDQTGFHIDDFQIQLSSKAQKAVSRYPFRNVQIVKNKMYLLFGRILVEIINYQSQEGQFQNIISLKRDYDKIFNHHNEIYMYPKTKYFSANESDTHLFVAKLVNGSDERIIDFDIKNPFFLHFQNSNHIVFYDSKVVFLYPDKPEFEIHYLEIEKVKPYTTSDVWDEPTDEESKRYNHSSYKNPERLFSDVAPRLECDLSVNFRIDKIDEKHFGITYLPGKSRTKESFDLKMDIWELTDSLIVYEKSYEAPGKENEIVQNDGTLAFGFPNFYGDTFVYLNGKRFQINVEPRADWTIKNSKVIKSEQNQSIIENDFVLCLYMGYISLP